MSAYSQKRTFVLSLSAWIPSSMTTSLLHEGSWAWNAGWQPYLLLKWLTR